MSEPINDRLLPKKDSEYELDKLMSECRALREVLQLNIENLLESFNEVTEDDNHSRKKARDSKEQNRGLSTS